MITASLTVYLVVADDEDSLARPLTKRIAGEKCYHTEAEARGRAHVLNQRIGEVVFHVYQAALNLDQAPPIEA